MIVVAPLFVTPMEPSVSRARYIDRLYSMSSSKSIFLSSRRACSSRQRSSPTDNCPSICSRAPTNVTPYTDVITVCFTTLRVTSSPPRSSVAMSRISVSELFRSSWMCFFTIFSTAVYTSPGFSCGTRFTCAPPFSSSPSAA